MKLTWLFCFLISLAISKSVASDNIDNLIEAGYKNCDSLSVFSAQAFKARQSGISKEMMLSMAKDSKNMTNVVELAYSDGAKLATETEFSQAVKLGCRNSVLKQITEEVANKNSNDAKKQQ